jgi:hypothetical protein
MTKNPGRPEVVSLIVPLRRLLRSGFVFLSCVVLLGGCSARKRPPIAWNTAILARPTTPPSLAAATDVIEDPVPELRLETPPFPLRVVSTRGAPARPRVGTSASNGAGNDAEKLESPRIAPSLSPQETVIARRQTDESLNIAEKNLAVAWGRSLNATQSDLVSKIQGFMKDAREAARIADWARARSFAKKAQVLSEELANSF